MKKITVDALLSDMLNSSSTLIDVRSETEFERGAVPRSRNLPLLYQAERHEIGIVYKNEGQAAAIQLGETLVGPHQFQRIEAWQREIAKSSDRAAVIMCWRGGLRSQIVCEWLEAAGENVRQLEGGYKAVRHRLLEQLENVPPLIVLEGLTGSGKTELLQSLGLPHIDIEGAAQHRGSTFGSWIERAQPAQATFENQLAWQMYSRGGPLLIEDESRLLGTLCVPETLLIKMRQAPVIQVQESRPDRVERIYREYIQASPPEDKLRLRDHTLKAFSHIERRLDRHGSRLRKLMIDAFAGNDDGSLHRTWIAEILELYYDKRYHFAIARNPRRVLFAGDLKSCAEWLRAGGAAAWPN